jgi:hypothetical protein
MSLFQGRTDSALGMQVMNKTEADRDSPQSVKWVVFATGIGRGSWWPGFVASVEVCGRGDRISKGTLHVIRTAQARKELPERLVASEGVVCLCQWDGAVDDVKAASAVFLETSQDT